MTILGRGVLGIPADTDSLLIGVGGVIDELPIGILNQVLTVTAGGVDWANVPLSALVISDITDVDFTGSGSPLANEVLTFNGSVWESAPAPGAGGGEVNDGLNLGTGFQIFTSKDGFDLQFKTLVGAGGLSLTQTANEITLDTSAISGTVTSIGITDPGGTDFNITGSPITSSGNIDFALKNTTVTPGSFTSVDITVDSKGRITAIANGGLNHLLAANNLNDVISASTSLSNLGGVALSGGTMSGLLILSADPIVALGAATKQYTDNKFVELSGDTMTGNLIMDGASIVSFTSQDLILAPAATKNVVISGLKYPTTDGTIGQVLVTDGFGTLSFTSDIAGLFNIVEDTTPQLGGNLDNNGFSIITDSNVILSFSSGGEFAVNWIDVKNSATGLGPVITVKGTDTNIDLVLDTKGTGNINVSTNKIVNVVDPVLAQDAATKNYVDSQITLNATDNLGDLLDVNLPSPNDNDLLTFDNGSGFWVATPPPLSVNKIILKYDVATGGGTVTADGSNILPSGWSEIITVVSGDTHAITYTHAEGHPPTSIGYWSTIGAGGIAPYKFTAPAVDSALFPVEAGIFATEFKLVLDMSNLGVITAVPPGGHFYVVMTF